MPEINNNLSLDIEIKKVNLLYQQNFAGMIAILFNSVAYITVTWNFLPRVFLFTWFFTLNFSSLVRLYAATQWKKQKSQVLDLKTLRPWKISMVLLLSISGSSWGLIGILSPGSPAPQEILTALLIAGMSGGAIASYAASRTAMNTVISLSLLPWSFAMLLTGGDFYLLMGSLTFLYALLTMALGKNLQRLFLNSLHLSEELKSQHQKLKDAREHQAANLAKSIFLANASHEIRTPLSAINGFAEDIIHRPDCGFEIRSDAEIILRHGRYLTSLVNDLLDLSKIETHQLAMHSVSLNPVQEIEDSLSVIRAELSKKNLFAEIRYQTHLPLKFSSDPVRFRQVLINLLSNALKFTQKGGIRIDVKCEAGFLNVTIADTGLGMSPTTIENLFQAFSRGDCPEIQKIPGSGLGLALSRNLARMMGGDLRLIASEKGQGSSFEFKVSIGNEKDLKFYSAEEIRSHLTSFTNVRSIQFLKSKNILVVEDADDLRLLMHRYLEKEGATVHSCENGAEAIERASRSSFDLILMDVKMPVMDGLEATRRLRAQSYRNLIFALTAHASNEDQQACLKAGCDGYLSKPVDMNLLSEMMQNYASSQKAIRNET